MTVKEYAALKGVHRETVYRWIRAGHVQIERTGPRGHYRVTDSRDVEICRDMPSSQQGTSAA